MKCRYVMICGHCLAHVDLPENSAVQGQVIDWFTAEHAGHLEQHEDICVIDRLVWACLNAAAFEPKDRMLTVS